jgi:hypothetical protein
VSLLLTDWPVATDCTDSNGERAAPDRDNGARERGVDHGQHGSNGGEEHELDGESGRVLQPRPSLRSDPPSPDSDHGRDTGRGDQGARHATVTDAPAAERRAGDERQLGEEAEAEDEGAHGR